MQIDRVGISAKVIADSSFNMSRLISFELTFPRIVLSEFNTHRVFSRNSASSRAIPVWKRLAEVLHNPYIPIHFGKNKSGMQSAEDLSEEVRVKARELWLSGRNIAAVQAFMLAGGYDQIMKDAKGDPKAEAVCEAINRYLATYKRSLPELVPLANPAHKQHVNRVLEPYGWHTVIATGTHWRNFYALRASRMAQPEIQDLAILMARAHMSSRPVPLENGEWHLPLIFDEDRREVADPMKLARISSARCGRVSYLTHDGKRALDKDLDMADGLQSNGHSSPFEHPALADTGGSKHHYDSNFGFPWVQYRKLLKFEGDFSQVIEKKSVLEGMNGDAELTDFVLSLPS